MAHTISCLSFFILVAMRTALHSTAATKSRHMVGNSRHVCCTAVATMRYESGLAFAQQQAGTQQSALTQSEISQVEAIYSIPRTGCSAVVPGVAPAIRGPLLPSRVSAALAIECSDVDWCSDCAGVWNSCAEITHHLATLT